jgi:acetyltransferase-like isoleucine patch superfamily enzyme
MKIISYFKNTILKFYNYLVLKKNNTLYEKDIKIKGKIYINSKGNITIGTKCLINSGFQYNPISSQIKYTRITIKENASLSIGKNVGISNTCIYCANNITIKDNVLIGDGTKIWDTDFHSLDPEIRNFKGDYKINTKPIVIEKGVFVGADSIILKGITIGENSIIGAGSIVSKNIPSNEIWAGNPAKFIKKIKDL